MEDQNNQSNKLARQIVGSAIYTGAFIMCSIIFDWRLAMVISLMIWGNKVVFDNDK